MNLTINKIIKSLFETKSFIGKKNRQKVNGFLLGFRKNYVVYDLERAIVTFLKVVNLITYLKNHEDLRILFIGSPPEMEPFMQKEVLSTSHYYFKSSDWVSGGLSNKRKEKNSPNLVVLFNPKVFFSTSEVRSQGIPLVSFMEAENILKNVDFPIVLNTKSQGALNMFLFLVKKSLSITKKNV